jgi:hypothetical protein
VYDSPQSVATDIYYSIFKDTVINTWDTFKHISELLLQKATVETDINHEQNQISKHFDTSVVPWPEPPQEINLSTIPWPEPPTDHLNSAVAPWLPDSVFGASLQSDDAEQLVEIWNPTCTYIEIIIE